MTPIAAFDRGAGPLPRAEVQAAFARDGIFIVRGLFDDAEIAATRRTLARLIAARLASLGRVGDPNEDLDALFGRLTADAPARGMDVIRIMKDLPDFYAAFTHPRVLEAAQAALDRDVLQCVHDIAQMRIDPPHDDTRTFGWHQDYPYNVASLHAVTGWWPLTPIDADMGPLLVIPGSHREIAPLRIAAADAPGGKGRGHAAMEIALDAADLEARAQPLEGVEPGDAAFFHGLLLHRGGHNRSSEGRARWVVNPRYADALDPDVAARGWRTRRDKDLHVFEELHPDKVLAAVA